MSFGNGGKYSSPFKHNEKRYNITVLRPHTPDIVEKKKTHTIFKHGAIHQHQVVKKYVIYDCTLTITPNRNHPYYRGNTSNKIPESFDILEYAVNRFSKPEWNSSVKKATVTDKKYHPDCIELNMRVVLREGNKTTIFDNCPDIKIITQPPNAPKLTGSKGKLGAMPSFALPNARPCAGADEKKVAIIRNAAILAQSSAILSTLPKEPSTHKADDDNGDFATEQRKKKSNNGPRSSGGK